MVRLLPSVRPVLVSYVLRVVTPADDDGSLAGTLEVVQDGTTVVFRSVEELLAVLVPRRGDEDLRSIT